MSGSNEYSGIEKLTKSNYNTWRTQVKALLTLDDLWNYVKESSLKLRSRKEKEKDEKAKSRLILCISPSLISSVEDCETTHQLWSRLAELYGDNGDPPDDLSDDVSDHSSDDPPEQGVSAVQGCKRKPTVLGTSPTKEGHSLTRLTKQNRKRRQLDMDQETKKTRGRLPKSKGHQSSKPKHKARTYSD